MKKYYFLIVVALILGLVLTGCSLLSNVGQVPATGQSGVSYLTKNGLVSGNLVGLWHFDEGSGTTASDSSDYSNDGALINGTDWDSGKFGDALSFDGIDDYVDCGNVSQLNGVSGFTVEFWIKVDSLPFPAEWQGIIARGNSGQRTPWVFGNQGYSNLYMQFETILGGPADCSFVTDDLTAGQWHNVAFTWDGYTVTSYLDGVPGPTDTTDDSVLADTDGSLKFGYIPGYTYFNGLIDEVRIWNVALTATQIQQSYEALHVDDDWVQWPGAYKTITEALAVAGDGDTIIVHKGAYTETVAVNKQVTLLGANHDVDPAGSSDRGDESVIDGMVKITADDATINGFKLTSSYIAAGYPSAKNITISYNILENVYAEWGAIHLHGGTNQCDGAYVGYNAIINAQGDGIWTVGNDNVTIEYNHILDNTGDRAIETLNHLGTGIVIHGNTITNSGGKGINYWAEDGGVITDNVITNSKHEAIYTDAQTTISSNQISGGDMYGVLVVGGAAGSTVSGNNISNTNWEGIQSDVQVIITNNDISGGYNGIQLSNAASGSVIDGNNIHDNRFWGLSILDSVTDVTITNNQLANNPYCGVIVWGDGEGYGIHINCNNITGNGIYGVESKRTVSDVDATNNWWGHATGPRNASTNPTGQGDEVSDNVNYSNWAYIPDFCDCEAKTIGYWKNHPDWVEGILIELDNSIEVGTGKFVGVNVFAGNIFAKPHSKTYSMLAAQLLAAKLNVAQLSQFIPGYNSDCMSEEINEADYILRLTGGQSYSERVEKYDREYINGVKTELDDFNNNEICQVQIGDCPCECFY